MRTWKTATSRALIIFAILFAVLAALVVAAMATVQSGWAERRIEGLASGRLGRNVDVEGLRVRASWPPEIEMAALRIPNPDWAQDRYLLDARGIRVTVEPLALL